VAGEAKAARMSEPLPVDEQQVGPLLDLTEGRKEDGYLAEGEESRHVGESHSGLHYRLLLDLHLRIADDDDGAAASGGAPSDGDVDAGHATDIRRSALPHDPGSQPTLNLHSVGCGDIPRVQVEGLHRTIIASARRGRNRRASRVPVRSAVL